MSKIAPKPYACTLANVTRLVFETCDPTRDKQRDVLAYLYSALHVDDHPAFYDKAMDTSHEPGGRGMSAAIELPPGDIEHIRLMYRELGVVLPKGHHGEGLPPHAPDRAGRPRYARLPQR